MNVLGVWDGHDSGAALLVDGRLRVAVNEERLTRRKLEVRFPSRAIETCLNESGLTPADVGLVAVSTSDPAKTLGRFWPGSKERYYAVRRRAADPGPLSAIARSLKYRITEWRPGPISRRLSRLALARAIDRHGLGQARLEIVDHHDAHAAAAAWASGFDACAVLTIDGLGDGASATISRFAAGRLTRVATSPARCSLGVLFEHVTHLLNMRELEDEGKVMALADYAAPLPDGENPLLDLIDVRDGVIHTRQPGHALRQPIARIHYRYPNEQFAYLAQRVVERTCLALARDSVRLTGLPRLAVAGGVVSNVKATRLVRLLDEVHELYVFPHMGDGGLALGAAIAASTGAGVAVDLDLQRLDWGPEVSVSDMARALVARGIDVRSEADLPARVADLLEQGRIVAWFQGRMEYGPRALGQRSVLARPDRAQLRDRLNLALKRRVWYQPFCPSMLDTEGQRLLADWSGTRNRAMTTAHAVRQEFRETLAGVISIDGTCRPQFVSDDAPGPFAELLRQARRRWGAGVVLNTSFNIHGEPLVCTPAEAIRVFVESGADALALGPFLIERTDITPDPHRPS